jgi:citrate lyase subunit beta/citryl-CoA lyase
VQPLRTALYVPAHKPSMMAKALASGADAVIFDLEDSVPLAAKSEARRAVADMVREAPTNGPVVMVRVNAPGSQLIDEDLEGIVTPGVQMLLLPKAEAEREVASVSEKLARLEAARGLPVGGIELVLLIESALGVYRCYDLLKASPRVASVCFGSARDGDLQADLGCGWSLEGTELLYARSKVLLDARAAGVEYPLDGVFADLGDEEGLFADSRLSARLGYVGRTVIHPKQIDPVRRAYAIPEAEVEYYKKVVRAFEQAEAAGSAAITVDGKMVDYAMYTRARKVLALAAVDASPRGAE